MYNDKPIYSVKKLVEFSNEKIRVIIASKEYKEIFFNLMQMDRKYNFQMNCFIPTWILPISNGEPVYHINRFLGYFRRKLFKGTMPTIISNDCVAGFLYDYLDMNESITSPTINTYIVEEDFLKLCKNPQYYLNLKIKPGKRVKLLNGEEIIEGELDDIKIKFTHSQKFEPDILMDRWNYMTTLIQWDKLFFVVREHYYSFPYEFEEEFLKIKYPHLLIKTKALSMLYLNKNVVFHPQFLAKSHIEIIEDYFDIVGWLNSKF